MNLVLDPFYPVVDNAAWVARLVEGGTRLVQLRVKDRPADKILAEIRQALAICRSAGAQLVVNDHWQAAIEAGADFVHLGQGDLDTADLAATRRAGIRLGVSTHDDDELERGLSTDPDYVALGPIYPTTLKVMPFAPQGLDRIGEWKRRIGGRPLVAIGGITLDRAASCFEAGADCLALVSDVTGHADPSARIRAWIGATRGRVA
jgi:thiamine-phosphate pyrophosphorylase